LEGEGEDWEGVDVHVPMGAWAVAVAGRAGVGFYIDRERGV